MKKIGSIKLGLLSLVAISGSVLANCPAPSALHLDKSQKHWLANGGWRSMKPTQIKPGTQFVFFTAEATYHDGSYPPDSDTTYSFRQVVIMPLALLHMMVWLFLKRHMVSLSSGAI